MKRETIINILNGYEAQLETEKDAAKILWLNQQIHEAKVALATMAEY